MIGKSYNKKYQSGQVLLITVMLLATAVTLALSASFTSKTETQITTLEKQSQEALAAAEAALEAALKEGTTVTIGQGSLSNITGFYGQATKTASCPLKTTFVSPLIQKDGQYTFYLSKYPGLSEGYWEGDLTIYFASEQTTCPSLELTFIGLDNSITKHLIDPDTCNNINKTSTDIIATATDNSNKVLGDTTFSYKTAGSISISQDKKLVFVRVFDTATKIGFSGTTNLSCQGEYVNSQATVKPTGIIIPTGGVTKKLQLFQSYPQIPSEFFVTSF